MSATWTPLDRNTHALRLAGARLTWYRLAGDVRSLTIQRAVVDRLLDERLTITQSAHAADIASVKRCPSRPPTTRGPWDQREAEAAAAGLASVTAR